MNKELAGAWTGAAQSCHLLNDSSMKELDFNAWIAPSVCTKSLSSLEGLEADSYPTWFSQCTEGLTYDVLLSNVPLQSMECSLSRVRRIGLSWPSSEICYIRLRRKNLVLRRRRSWLSSQPRGCDRHIACRHPRLALWMRSGPDSEAVITKSSMSHFGTRQLRRTFYVSKFAVL